MGVRCHLSLISATDFRQLTKGGDPDLGNGTDYFLDKAWDDFHTVFREQGHPLNCTIGGDFIHPSYPYSIDDFYEERCDFFAGFTSPLCVKHIAEALSKLTTADLQKWYDQYDVGEYDLDYYLFDQLKAAYVAAAGSGSAIMISIG